MGASGGFVELICSSGQDCKQSVQIPVCAEGQTCPSADAFINAWYAKPLDPNGDNFRRLHVYAQKLSYNASTGMITVDFGIDVELEHGGSVEVGLNWLAVGDSTEFKLTPGGTTCTGTTAANCSGNNLVAGAVPAGFTFGGFLIKEFDIATSGAAPDVGPRQITVDTLPSFQFGSDAFLSTNCGMLGPNKAHSTVNMSCNVQAVALASQTPGVQALPANWSISSSVDQVFYWQYLNSPALGKPFGMAPGLKRFVLTLGASAPVNEITADCGYVEVPPICYPGVPCGSYDTMHQWSGGLLRGPGQGYYDAFDAVVDCEQIWLK